MRSTTTTEFYQSRQGMSPQSDLSATRYIGAMVAEDPLRMVEVDSRSWARPNALSGPQNLNAANGLVAARAKTGGPINSERCKHPKYH